MKKGIKKAIILLATSAVLVLMLWLYFRPYAVDYTVNGMRFSHPNDVSELTLVDSAISVNVSGTLRRIWVKELQSFAIEFSGTLSIGGMVFDDYSIWFSEEGVGHFMHGQNSSEPYGAASLLAKKQFSEGYVLFFDAGADDFNEIVVWPAQTVEEANLVVRECGTLSQPLLRKR